MPGSTLEASLKRKRREAPEDSKKRRKSSSPETDETDIDDTEQSRILLLEKSILESKKNYNNIVTLIEILANREENANAAIVAAVALCRVFVRLLAQGNLSKKKDASEKDKTVTRWLRDRLVEYKRSIVAALAEEDTASTALTLSMRVLKAEAEHMHGNAEYYFPGAFLAEIITALIQTVADQNVRNEFVEKFANSYDDLRFYTFKTIREIIIRSNTSLSEESLDNLFNILAAIDRAPTSKDGLENFYVEAPKQKSHSLFSLSQHKKQAQEAWLTFLRLGLTKDQKKKILSIMSTSVAPWFTKPELLMDFLTDCYNSGGSISLLALSGVFYLIQERNLDYPSFYTKLYSLLDADILHSKHRSRFFRLLDTFLASSHLPAVLVASFIKRLSRLALNAPPSAIVAIVPWIYNLMRKHPLCTFMMHRVPRTQEERDELENEGLEDPFVPGEPDPMETGAIDSCLWEIVQLQSHYHPNVATIAKIISEQFTKQFYNLEDFLDHSYGSLLDAEMTKEIKKAPVIEYMIPKRIFYPAESGSGERESLLVELWDFGPQ
ncbi:hypothetical protein VTK73DRAFT_753 [Phialemonium thermophilum]|uniref:CCAAT-binding factor domain-containing protein n=1 Tax=Phialemonium thermophilum TaxID=223376 RepID=A0ABR3VUI5_9PEZI